MKAPSRAKQSGLPSTVATPAVSSQLGSWERSLSDGVMTWSPETYALFGVNAEHFVLSFENILPLLHQDDVHRMQAIFSQVPSRGQPREVEYRIVRPDGQIRLLYEWGEVICDALGKPERLIGVITDITEREQADQLAQGALGDLGRIVAVQQEIAATKLDLQAVLKLIVKRTQTLTSADGATIELIDGADLVCRAASGTALEQLGARMPRAHSLAGIAIEQRTLLVSVDAENDPRVNQAALRLIQGRSIILAPLLDSDEVVGVLKVCYRRRAAFGKREIQALQLLVVSLGTVIQRHRDAEQLRRSEAQYRLLFESNPQPMLVHDLPRLRVLAVNQAAISHYGYPKAQFLKMNLRELCAADERDKLTDTLVGIAPDAQYHAVWQQVKQNGDHVDMDIVSHTIEFNGQRARLLLGQDITERRRNERDLARVSRAQSMLSACNEALVRAVDEASLLVEICRIVVEIGGYRTAWVGFAMQDVAKTVTPAAHFGSDSSYLRKLRISWCPDEENGRGPVGRTIRSGQITLVDDVTLDPDYLPWRQRALEMGYRGVRTLPLRDGDRTFGILSLYVVEANTATEDELVLLLAMADDLAFGIANLRLQEDRRRINAAVLKVAASVSASTGGNFFEQLVRNMADAVGAQIGFVARLLAGEPLVGRTIAMLVDGNLVENIDYLIPGSPCERLLSDGVCIISENFGELYPNTPLTEAGASAYIGRLLHNAHGKPVGILCVAFRHPLQQIDFISSTLQIFATRAAAELDRQASDSQLRAQASLLDKAQDAIIVRTLHDRIVYWNKSAERLYGWPAATAIGQALTQLVSGDLATSVMATEQVMQQGEWTGEILQRRQDGTTFSIEGRWTLIRDEQGTPQSIFEINTDITSRKAAEKEIQHLAYYDALTKLPNRLLLQSRLQYALAASARTRTHGALLFIDLDNFKTLNDTLGHDQGDLLLQEVAKRLTSCVREADTLARLGGDEFVVMLEGLSLNLDEAITQATLIGEKTLHALNAPYLFAAYRHHSTASIGITLFDGEQVNVGDLLKRADLAMYQAKAAGRNTMRFFDPQMQKLATERVLLEADLRLALQNQEFVLHYQPQVERGGKITGVEALLRWRHPRRGLVSPLEFIPFAEESGLILPIGLWVLESACSQLAQWSEQESTAHLQMAVNVSARQFRHSDFVKQVLQVLERSAIDPHLLKLELTESLLLDNVEETIAKMMTLKQHGVGFALDDFGTGYSSLSYLKRLPLSQLKIDQSFVRDVLSDPNDAAIARTIVALAHSMGLSVMAEGVETTAQREFLEAHGCDAYQGYLFSRPLAIEALSLFITDATA